MQNQGSLGMGAIFVDISEKLDSMRIATCNLCQVGLDGPWYNRPLTSHPDFHVLPSLGSIVPGYLLIVPRNHVLSASALSAKGLRDLRSVVAEMRSLLRSHFGPTVCFEHGPSAPGSNLGCSVDHAHMHLVPIRAELSDLSSIAHLTWEPVEGLHALREKVSGRDYIYFEDDSGRAYVTYFSNSPSEGQLVRRALADFLGLRNTFDWRTHQFEENMIQTLKAFEPGHRIDVSA